MTRANDPVIRTLLVDDNQEFLDLAEKSLSQESLIRIVGTASGGLEALQKSRELKPDLIVLDVSMPDMSGLKVTQFLKGSTPAAPCVILISLNDHQAYRTAAFQAKADGFVSKSEFKDSLIPLIRTLFRRQQ